MKEVNSTSSFTRTNMAQFKNHHSQTKIIKSKKAAFSDCFFIQILPLEYVNIATFFKSCVTVYGMNELKFAI